MEELMTWKMNSMWSDLPTDILERIFTFLPIASVCRFKTLSKSWNRYITSPAFTHAQASNVSPEEYLLIVAPKSWFSKYWRVLDVARRKFLTLSDEFLTNYVQRQGPAPLGRSGPYLAAATGGLFCMKYNLYNNTHFLASHFICNPIMKTVKQLPPLVVWSGKHQVTVMSIDKVSMEYEIFVVNIPDRYNRGGHAVFEPHSILVYESKSGSWRSAPYKQLNTLVNYPSYEVWWDTLTIFRNQHYCIAHKGSRGGVVSYDKETGEISDLAGVDIPLASTSQLVVSKDKLFCVIPVKGDTYDFSSIQIFEINVAKNESILLTMMPNDLLFWILGNDFGRQFSIPQYKIALSADSILICTLIGRCAAYNLSEKSWYKYPDNHNLLKFYYHPTNMTREELCDSNYCLSLCPP